MRDLIDIDAAQARAAPLPRRVVDAAGWTEAAEACAEGAATLLALWAQDVDVHMALFDPQTLRIGVVTLEGCAAGFPSVGAIHPPAQRLERTIRDLNGLAPLGAPDARPWLDHGRWGVSAPLGAGGPGDGTAATPYAFLPVEGDSLNVVPVGPIHAGVIEPGHFRFTAQGETVVRLEERFGYTHKGTEALMRGADLSRGADLAGRVSGDSVVAYGWAFAQAAEAALGVAPPPRAVWLRAVMAEMERLANHLGDIGAICNDAAFAMMLAHCSVLRERVLRAADTAFGHRLMRDMIRPGGVARDLNAEGMAAIRALVADVAEAFPALVALYDNSATLLERTVTTGHVGADLTRQFGAGGFVGRASGREFDLRRDFPYAPYDAVAPKVARRETGDVDARIWVRIDEVTETLRLLGALLDGLPAGPVIVETPAAGAPREGLGWVEGFRGDILVWIALDAAGRIERCHLRDPSWFQWPLLEASIEGDIIADFPLCNKSFNCSYSGSDL